MSYFSCSVPVLQPQQPKSILKPSAVADLSSGLNLNPLALPYEPQNPKFELNPNAIAFSPQESEFFSNPHEHCFIPVSETDEYLNGSYDPVSPKSIFETTPCIWSISTPELSCTSGVVALSEAKSDNMSDTVFSSSPSLPLNPYANVFTPNFKLDPSETVFSPGRKFQNVYANGLIPISSETNPISSAGETHFETHQNLDTIPVSCNLSTPDLSDVSDFGIELCGTDEGERGSFMFSHPKEYGAFMFIYTLSLSVILALILGPKEISNDDGNPSTPNIKGCIDTPSDKSDIIST